MQRADDVAVVKPCPIIFTCDGKARAASTASWYRQMGFADVYVVDGGTAAWRDGGLALEQGGEDVAPVGFAAAQAKVSLVTPQALHADPPPVVVFVDTSQDFARAHVPGAHWVPRGWLEFQIGDPWRSRIRYPRCRHLQRRAPSHACWRYPEGPGLSDRYGAGGRHGGPGKHADLPVEQGLSGVMRAPTDVVLSGPDRNFADMMHYLRWEEALGTKYGS